MHLIAQLRTSRTISERKINLVSQSSKVPKVYGSYYSQSPRYNANQRHEG